METAPKSSQEMAAQIMDSYPYFSSTAMPEEHVTRLDAHARKLKDEIKDINPYLLPDDVLLPKLADVQQRALESGVWNPIQGEGADERTTFAIDQNKKYGYTDEEAAALVPKDFKYSGMLNGIRGERRDRERNFRYPIDEYVKAHELSAEDEENEVAKLLERTVDLTTLTATEITRLSKDFPSGNFVYHGAETEQLVQILDNGALVNSGLLYEREQQAAKAEERDASLIRRNSGYEGISWSMNGIDALPGDRYHLAGFVGAPEAVLSETQQFAVPSRPAPNEVLQVSDTIDAAKFYDAKTQFELYADQSVFGESNSVANNLFAVTMWADEEKRELRDEPILLQAKADLFIEPDYQDQLRELYEVQTDGTVRLNPDLLQQVGNAIPVAAVWLQAAIDTGRLEDTIFAGKEIPEIIDGLTRENAKTLLTKFLKDLQPSDDIITEAEKVTEGIEVPLEKMYFVAPRKDAGIWLRVIARSEHKPAGVLLYDDKKVRLENFASFHKGDHTELTNELQAAISPDNKEYIEYSNVLGTEFSDDMRAGARHQVIAERHLVNRRTIKKVNGKIVID